MVMKSHPYIDHEMARTALATDLSRIAHMNISRKLRDKKVTAAIEAQIAQFGQDIVAGALASIERQMAAKARIGQ
jgi:hypothetical protein